MQRHRLQDKRSSRGQRDYAGAGHPDGTRAQQVHDDRHLGNDAQTRQRDGQLVPRLCSGAAHRGKLHRAARRKRPEAEAKLQEPGCVVTPGPQQRAEPPDGLETFRAGGVLPPALLCLNHEQLTNLRRHDLDVLAKVPHQGLELFLAPPTLLEVVAKHHHRRHEDEDQ